MIVREFENHWLPHLLKVSAITLGNSIYYRGHMKPAIKEHEMVHIKQQERVGALWFWISYLFEYVVYRIIYRNHNRAYMSISWEREAYKDDS